MINYIYIQFCSVLLQVCLVLVYLDAVVHAVRHCQLALWQQGQTTRTAQTLCYYWPPHSLCWVQQDSVLLPPVGYQHISICIYADSPRAGQDRTHTSAYAQDFHRVPSRLQDFNARHMTRFVSPFRHCNHA